MSAGRFNHQDGRRAVGMQPPHRPAWQIEIVARREGDPAIIAEQIAAPLVHEQQLVAVGVARQIVHGTG